MKSSHYKIYYSTIFNLLLLTGMLAWPDPVFATSADTPMGNVLCNTIGWFTGNTGKGIATLGLTILGVGALLGKISWGTAMIHGVGGAILFEAAGIVSAMGSGANGCG